MLALVLYTLVNHNHQIKTGLEHIGDVVGKQGIVPRLPMVR